MISRRDFLSGVAASTALAVLPASAFARSEPPSVPGLAPFHGRVPLALPVTAEGVNIVSTDLQRLLLGACGKFTAEDCLFGTFTCAPGGEFLVQDLSHFITEVRLVGEHIEVKGFVMDTGAGRVLDKLFTWRGIPLFAAFRQKRDEDSPWGFAPAGMNLFTDHGRLPFEILSYRPLMSA